MVRLLGVHEQQVPAYTAQEYAGARGTRLFVPKVARPRDLVRKLKIQCKDTWAAGQVAVWSFKPHPQDVANGKWRKPVEDLARYVHANHPKQRTAIVIWHEPENDIGKWFDKPEDFVRLFNTVHGWIVGVHPDAWTVHAALGYMYGIKDGISDGQAKRWRTKARVNAIDAYSGRTWPIDQILPEHPGYVRWRRHVANTGLWGVTERGWTITGNKKLKLRTATMQREFAWLKSLPKDQRPVVYLVWNTPGEEDDRGLLLDPDAKGAISRGFQGVYKPPLY